MDRVKKERPGIQSKFRPPEAASAHCQEPSSRFSRRYSMVCRQRPSSVRTRPAPADGVGGQGLYDQGQAQAEAAVVTGDALGDLPGIRLSKGHRPRVAHRELPIGLGQGRTEVLGHLVEVVTGGRKEQLLRGKAGGLFRLICPLSLLLLQGLQLFQKIALKDGKWEAGFLGKVLRVHVHHIGPVGGVIRPEIVGVKGRLILWVVPEGEETGMNESGLPIHLQHLI